MLTQRQLFDLFLKMQNYPFFRFKTDTCFLPLFKSLLITGFENSCEKIGEMILFLCFVLYGVCAVYVLTAHRKFIIQIGHFLFSKARRRIEIKGTNWSQLSMNRLKHKSSFSIISINTKSRSFRYACKMLIKRTIQLRWSKWVKKIAAYYLRIFLVCSQLLFIVRFAIFCLYQSIKAINRDQNFRSVWSVLGIFCRIFQFHVICDDYSAPHLHTSYGERTWASRFTYSWKQKCPKQKWDKWSRMRQ